MTENADVQMQAAAALLIRCGVDVEDQQQLDAIALELDDVVHDCVQEAGLDGLNTMEGEAEQEQHIGGCEADASSINNGGAIRQVAYLMLHNPVDQVEMIVQGALANA